MSMEHPPRENVSQRYDIENNSSIINDDTDLSLTIQECIILWRAKNDRRWWITAYDFMAAGIERSEAYARFAILTHKATFSRKRWGMTAIDGRRNVLCFHLDDDEWTAIRQVLKLSKYNNEV